MASILPTTTIRRSPYYESTVAEGVSVFATYNHMLMPLSYDDPALEYRRLTEGVAQWDVGCERQVEVVGPDAERLVQALVPRKIGELRIGAGWYAPVCDHRGVLINDPVLLRLAPDRFWFSVADLDLLYWVRAIAGERDFDASVFEPDVSPLAIQGPKAADVVASLFGSSVHSIRHFQFIETDLDGIPIVLCRSGWSHQGGFELFLLDGSRGNDLWSMVRDAGRPFDIGPGAPNEAERVESGLFSWSGDADDTTNPFEVRLGRYVDLHAPNEVIGLKALRQLHATGPRRHQVGVVLDHDAPLPEATGWSSLLKNGAAAGQVTALIWSPRLNRNIGLCLASKTVGLGDAVRVVLEDGTEFPGSISSLPFV